MMEWYLHDQSSVGDICYPIQRAIQLYEDKQSLNKIRNRNAQTIPGKSCQEYIGCII
jgi:starch synthase